MFVVVLAKRQRRQISGNLRGGKTSVKAKPDDVFLYRDIMAMMADCKAARGGRSHIVVSGKDGRTEQTVPLLKRIIQPYQMNYSPKSKAVAEKLSEGLGLGVFCFS